MHKDSFQYFPKFKLLFHGNHKPGVRNVGAAMRRRIRMILFPVAIPESQQDSHLEDKLRGEWPGILAWMVEGCLIWRERGLATPEAVIKATGGCKPKPLG